MHIAGGNVNAVGELAADDLAVGLVVANGQANVLIQGKAADFAEVQAVFVVAAGQFIVDGQRGGTRGQADHGVGLGANQGLDGVGGQGANFLAAGEDDDLHETLFLSRPPFAGVQCWADGTQVQHAPSPATCSAAGRALLPCVCCVA